MAVVLVGAESLTSCDGGRVEEGVSLCYRLSDPLSRLDGFAGR